MKMRILMIAAVLLGVNVAHAACSANDIGCSMKIMNTSLKCLKAAGAPTFLQPAACASVPEEITKFHDAAEVARQAMIADSQFAHAAVQINAYFDQLVRALDQLLKATTEAEFTSAIAALDEIKKHGHDDFK